MSSASASDVIRPRRWGVLRGGGEKHGARVRGFIATLTSENSNDIIRGARSASPAAETGIGADCPAGPANEPPARGAKGHDPSILRMNEEGASPPELERRLARLTPGQRLCLLLVREHRSSKEIARRLGVSPHTVDQRMRSALKILGVSRRIEAARLLQAWMETSTSPRAVLPFATRRCRQNNMSILSRLGWIASIAGAAALAAGIFLAAAESLAKMFQPG